jgi:hypothetical protein
LRDLLPSSRASATDRPRLQRSQENVAIVPWVPRCSDVNCSINCATAGRKTAPRAGHAPGQRRGCGALPRPYCGPQVNPTISRTAGVHDNARSVRTLFRPRADSSRHGTRRWQPPNLRNTRSAFQLQLLPGLRRVRTVLRTSCERYLRAKAAVLLSRFVRTVPRSSASSSTLTTLYAHMTHDHMLSATCVGPRRCLQVLSKPGNACGTMLEHTRAVTRCQGGTVAFATDALGLCSRAIVLRTVSDHTP